jgi:DNA-binding CsgD family transcriptional regulator
VAKARAVIAIATSGIRDDIARAAEGLIDVAATRGEIEPALASLDGNDGRIDLAIVDLAALRALVRRSRRMPPNPPWQSPAAVLVLPSGELQDALGLLHRCQGVLFWEHDIDKLRGLLIVTLEGYSGVRPELLPDFITDRVRAGLIERLTPIERRALDLLGQALSNRAIARELSVAESIAKSLVRAVLTKLRLKNRTEAAVLAARWSGAGAAGPTRETGHSPAQVASSL